MYYDEKHEISDVIETSGYVGKFIPDIKDKNFFSGAEIVNIFDYTINVDEEYDFKSRSYIELLAGVKLYFLVNVMDMNALISNSYDKMLNGDDIEVIVVSKDLDKNQAIISLYVTSDYDILNDLGMEIKRVTIQTEGMVG